MTKNQKEHLIADTFTGESGEEFALLAAAHVRRRSTVRRAAFAAVLIVAISMTIVVTRQARTVPVTVLPPALSFEVISDDELVAQLKDQPVLLLKDGSGIREVVFLALDEASNKSPSADF
jgi:hypothetical protein